MSKSDHKNKGIVRVMIILANILPRCYVIHDVGLCFLKNEPFHFLFSFLVLEEKRKWNIAVMTVQEKCY